jgi:hypothetical protein
MREGSMAKVGKYPTRHCGDLAGLVGPSSFEESSPVSTAVATGDRAYP